MEKNSESLPEKKAVFEQLFAWRDSAAPLRLVVLAPPFGRVSEVDGSLVRVDESSIEFSWSLETRPFMRSSGSLEVFLDDVKFSFVTTPPRVTIERGPHRCVIRETTGPESLR